MHIFQAQASSAVGTSDVDRGVALLDEEDDEPGDPRRLYCGIVPTIDARTRRTTRNAGDDRRAQQQQLAGRPSA